MTEGERAYERGIDDAWRRVLRMCLQQLGTSSDDGKLAAMALERADAVHVLRAVCSEFGDSEWKDDLHLADIIEKHLHRNLRGTADGN